MTTEMSHVRKPSVARWLSSCCCGLGQIYCGRVGRGLAMYSVSMMLWPLTVILVSLCDFSTALMGLAVVFLALTGVSIWSARDARSIAHSMAAIDYEPQDYNRPLIYGLMIATWLPSAIGIGLFLRASVLEAFYLPTSSMAPSLVAGDRVLTKKLGIERATFERGDVVVFRNPQNRKQNFIKRIVGFPGESVEVKDGQLFINEQPLTREPIPDGDKSPPMKADGKKALYERSGDRKYAIFTDAKGDAINTPKQTVPIGTYFVLGDNRGLSLDSSEFGPIPHADIVGQVILNYWPSDSWKRFGAVR